MRKKIMIITIALMMAFTLIPSVSAFVEADAGGLVSDSYTPCTSGNCFYVKLQKNTYFSGMRMSLVDNKGKRVLGSGYIDLVKKGKHMACGNSCTDLQPTKLDLSALQWKNGQTLYRADGNYTKQELAEYASDDTGIHVQKPKKTDAGLPTVSVYALPSMPDIAALGNSAGLENYLVRFFKPNKDAHGVQTATDKQMVIYKALGMSATDVSNMLNTEQIDRYIVVEPLVFLENHRKVGNKTEIAYYYGTITEVYKLYRQRGLRNWYYGVSNRYASSIYVKDKLKSITDNNGTSQRNYATELAGLRSAQRLKFKEEYYLSNVGFSAGLVWLGDFNDNHAYECTIDNKNVRYPLTRDGKPCCAAVEDNLSHYYGSAGTEAEKRGKFYVEFPYCKCDVNNKNNFPPYSNSYFCCDFVLTKNPRNFNAKYYNNDFIMDINTMSDRIDYKVSPNVTKSLLFQKYPACSGTVGGCDLNNPNDFPPISSSRTCCDVFLQTGAISEEALKNKYPGCFEPTRREEEECKFSDPNNFPPKSDSKYCCEYILNNHVKSKEELYAKYPECNPNYCDVKPYASMPQDCEESTIGVARDIGVNEEEWKCIFQQKGSEDPYAKEFYTPNEHKIENDYCTVACREEIAYSFPSSYINVLGGNHFTVGDVSNLGNISSVYPVQFIGTSTCRTGLNQSNKAEIDYNKFASDYNTADRDVREKWDLYQIAKQKNDHSATADPGNPYKEDTTCKHHKQICEKAIRGGGVESCSAGSSGCSCHDGECDEMNQCDRYDYSIPVNYTGNIHSQTNPATYSTGCGHSKPDYEAEMKQAEKDYKEAVAKRDGMYESIKQCSSFQRTYNEFDPQVGFSYSEKKYQSSYQLKRELVKKESYSKLYSFGSSSYRTWDTGGYTTDGFITDTSLVVGNYPGIVQKSECSGESRCVYSAEPLKYPRVSKVEQVTSTTYNYVLPDNVYRYVTKEGVSYNNEYEIEEDMEYLDMGYSNLPVSYNTKPGKYDYYIEFNNLQNGNKNLFGLTQKFSRVDKWNIFDSGGVSDKFGLPVSQNMGYHCTYDVKQEFHNSCDPEVEDCDNYCNPEVEDCYDWCDPEVEDCDDGGPKGVRVIYRPIDLKNPFPGTDGNGRDPGANWNGENLDGNDLKTKYITNNRNVDTYDVYYQKPLYEFILTPENIRRIRRYNKSIDKSFADFNLECTNGINCKSKFLRDGIGNEFFKFTMKNNDGGSCFSASDPDWENCRSVNVGG